VSSSPTYLDPVVIPLVVGETVLDVACGYGRWGHLIQSNYWEAGYYSPPVVDGFDAFAPNVEYCAAQDCYRHVWQQELPSPLEGAWDTVLACEIIEHVHDYEQVVEILERVATRRIIFTTPNWPAFRGGLGTRLGFNEYEAHKSYVPRTFFEQRGYRVRGAGFGRPTSYFVKVMRKLGAKPLLQGLPTILPSLAESIVAVKDFD
jgi:SAM-dependent methyltransferase